MNIHDRVAIITGAGRGIGRALAIEFARNGASVVCCARTEKDIHETAAIIEKENGVCLPIQTDVSDIDQVHRMVAQAIQQFGRIDVLFNNAARIPVINGLWEVDPDLWWEELTVDLRGPMLCCNAVLPHMMKRNEGVIINMSGGSNIPGRTSYCCSKVALIRMTELLARELEIVGSNVVAFCMGPGLVKTKRTLHEAQSPEGIQWNPATKKAFEDGDDRPPEDCAQATIKILNKSGAELNGKIFSTDDIIS
ncbi:SDR family NAD(P)-dependent oxidoreductase [Candidatus Latescibacterota bacterium]